MLRSKTVFVVGAGASKEAGLPIGRELRTEISDKLKARHSDFGELPTLGDSIISQMLFQQRYYIDSDAINRYSRACRVISDGVIHSASTDDFIDSHRDDRDITVCAKLAIARAILEAERHSKLFYEKNNIYNTVNFSSVVDTWYPSFFELLSQGVTTAGLDGLFDKATVISFNYDRCVEHYLVHAIPPYYDVSIDRARQLVEKLTIYHPYGSVGPYFGLHDQAVEFGFKGLPDFDKIVKNLKTYTEQIDDNEELSKIRKAITEADVLVFLGTAFHDNNMTLLRTETTKPQGHHVTKRIFATRKGITSEADRSVVRQQLADLCQIPLPNLRNDMHFADECHQLFSMFQKSLRSG